MVPPPRKQKVEGMYVYISFLSFFFSLSLFSSGDISSSLKRAELPPRKEKREKKKEEERKKKERD